jgi:hypothetical protein
MGTASEGAYLPFLLSPGVIGVLSTYACRLLDFDYRNGDYNDDGDDGDDGDNSLVI